MFVVVAVVVVVVVFVVGSAGGFSNTLGIRRHRVCGLAESCGIYGRRHHSRDHRHRVGYGAERRGRRGELSGRRVHTCRPRAGDGGSTHGRRAARLGPEQRLYRHRDRREARADPVVERRLEFLSLPCGGGQQSEDAERNERTNERTNKRRERTNERTNEQRNKANERTNKRREQSERTNERTNKANERTNEANERTNERRMSRARSRSLSLSLSRPLAVATRRGDGVSRHARRDNAAAPRGRHTDRSTPRDESAWGTRADGDERSDSPLLDTGKGGGETRHDAALPPLSAPRAPTTFDSSSRSSNAANQRTVGSSLKRTDDDEPS